MSQFKDLEMAYFVIENYDYGTIDRQMYREAVQFFLKEIEKKFGKDDFRFRELFSLTFKDSNWEQTFEIRSLCHAILLECPHTTQEQCEKGRTLFESAAEEKCRKDYPDWKFRKCNHCSYLEGIKEKWEKKDGEKNG